MTRALLYQPGPRWRIGVALGAAALIHFAAIALASIHQREQINDLPPAEESGPTIEVEPQSPTDDPTTPPDMIDSPTPNPTDESIGPEERSTPAPIHHQTTRLTTPIVNVRSATIGSQGLSSARVSALSAPRLEYPYEARRQKITGSGIAIITVDPVNGNVTSVAMEASTGSPVLDNAAVTGFRRWRFKPGTVSRVKSPITYTLTGAQY
jgi:periplasmic protein TonB